MHRPFSLLRRSTGMVAAVALVMLVGAAAAQADNISAIASQQFSGVVDSAPSCTDPTSVMIDWGDTSPQSVGAINASGVSRLPHLRHERHVQHHDPSREPKRPELQRRLLDRHRSASRHVLAVPTGRRQLGLPVPDHGHQQRQPRSRRPQPGAVRELGRLIDRRGQQLVEPDIAHAAVGAWVGAVRIRRRWTSAIPAPALLPAGCAPPPAPPRDDLRCHRDEQHLLIPEAARAARRLHRARRSDRQYAERLRGSNHLVLERERRHESRPGQLLAGATARSVDLFQPRGAADLDHDRRGLLADGRRGVPAQGGHQHCLVLGHRQPRGPADDRVLPVRT